MAIACAGQHNDWLPLNAAIEVLEAPPAEGAASAAVSNKIYTTAADSLELTVFVDRLLLLAGWRAAAALQYGSFQTRATGQDARFSSKLFASKMLRTTEKKFEAALGRGESFTETRDVVLLRQIESHMNQLQADGWSAFAAAMSDACPSVKRARGKGGVAAPVGAGLDGALGDAADEEGAAGPPVKKARKKRTVPSTAAKGWWAAKLALEYAAWQGSRERRHIEERILGEARADVTIADEAGGWDEQFVHGQFHNHKRAA